MERLTALLELIAETPVSAALRAPFERRVVDVSTTSQPQRPSRDAALLEADKNLCVAPAILIGSVGRN